MSELDFSHHVSEIPRGEQLPEAVQRRVNIQQSQIPDFQGAVSNYAENTNWMSALGSSVAAKSSSAIAAKLGGELGKNPQGDIGPSFTEFDKEFAQSYETQAHSTLGLQAQKLITNSNLELAAQPRIDSNLIASTQKSTLDGLEKIFSLAPSSIRPQMEYQYGSVMINQNEQLVKRMLGEQKEDRLEQLELSTQLNSENAHSLALNGTQTDKNGDSKSALSYVNSTIAAAHSAAARNDITLARAKEIEDTVRLSYLSGKYTRLALQADKEKKLPEFYKSLADNPPKDINDKDHIFVINNVFQYMNQQAHLRLQDQQLKIAQFEEKLMVDPLLASTQFSALTSDLTPFQAENVKIKLIQAMKKQLNQNKTSEILSTNWNDPTAFANITAETINKTFNDKVKYAIERSHKTTIPLKSPEPISRDDAEVMVASSAAGQIPVFTKTLQNKLMSSNPLIVESAILQIHKLKENGNGQALKGLQQNDWAMFAAAQSLRDSPDPIKANQEAHDRIYNQDPKIAELNDKKFNKILEKENTAGISNDSYALKKFGMSKSDFLNPTIATAYGMDILGKLQNYFSILGDMDQAKVATQHWVDENYGDTFINGGKHTTLHPVEREVGFQDRDCVPYIQYNFVEQLNTKLIPLKMAYDKNEVNEYWETIPVSIPKVSKNNLFPLEISENQLYLQMQELEKNPEIKKQLIKIPEETKYLQSNKEINFEQPKDTPSSQHGLFYKTYDPIKIKRHMRTPQGKKTDVFNVILIGNAYGNYDVAIETKNGMRNLFREAPALGIMSISPNKKAIMDHYMRDHK